MIGELHTRREARTLTLEAAGRSHVGLRRGNNEDELLIDPERGLFAVIDGMGGQAAGEIAAQLARQVLSEHQQGDLAVSMAEAARRIHSRAQQDPRLHGMGCVATAARVQGERLELAHVGDTRAWLAGPEGCQQLTRDHTLAAEAREEALLAGVEPPVITLHAVTRDLGASLREGDSWVDRVEARLRPGDLLVMASDGLHDLVPDVELLGRLSQAQASGRGLAALVDDLVELALSRGGHDNVTVLAVRALPPPPPPRKGPGPALLLGIGALILALLIGGLWAAMGPGRPELAAGVGEAPERAEAPGPDRAAPGGELLTPEGLRLLAQAELPARFETSTRALLTETLPPGGELTVASGAQVWLRGFRVVDPSAAGRWVLRVEPGATLELEMVRLSCPQVVLRLEVGEGATLRMQGTLNLADLEIDAHPTADLAFQTQLKLPDDAGKGLEPGRITTWDLPFDAAPPQAP